MLSHEQEAWLDILDFPFQNRSLKPRTVGLTMVIDKGLGLTDTRDLLELASNYIDHLKLTFGTSAFYNTRLLRQKIELVKSYGVHIFPGGTFLELALLQGRIIQYLDRARDLGFTGVEISDGTINIDEETRYNTIKLARTYGFDLVVSEVGKKDPRDQSDASIPLYEQVNRDLNAGSDVVIVEGRESGEGVVIYDSEGNILGDELNQMVQNVSDLDRLLWEAPQKKQQQELIMRFGPNVNLGNVQREDVLALEALRVGLRGDTLRHYYLTLQGLKEPVKWPKAPMVQGGTRDGGN